MKPRIGQIVHYTLNEGEVRAAIVTRVNDDGTVGLHVFLYYETGGFDLLPAIEQTHAPAGSPTAIGKWSLP